MLAKSDVWHIFAFHSIQNTYIFHEYKLYKIYHFQRQTGL